MKQKGVLLVYCLLLLHFFCFAQPAQLTGTVQDATNKMPLAFVTILIKETNTGTVTDIDGKFTFLQIPGDVTLSISYIGYKPKVLAIKKNTRSVNIEIEKNDLQLDAVIIGNGENPAHRIIRLLQENRKRNDPYFQSSFKYNAYTVAALGAGKALFTSNRPDTLVKEMKAIKTPKQKGKDKKQDSATADIQKRFMENYLMLTESYTERIFSFPNRSKETVLASKVSGLKTAAFAITSTNFQPFGFYKDYFPLNDKSFVSPIINGSIALYKFRLKETVINRNDSTFIISFEPKKDKNFNGLKGMLFISSDGYAIENVIASAANEKDLVMRFRLQQKYERIQGHWFPSQLNTTISQTDITTDSVLIYWDSRSYITNARIGDTFPKSTFSDIGQEFDLAAGKKTDADWDTLRADTLKSKEKATYENYKLLPAKTLNNINRSNAILDALGLEAIPWGKVDIPFKYLINGINRFEKFRLGGGIQTNPSFNKYISLGAFGGYGFGDKAWKYGGNLLFTLNERTATKIRLSYSQDVQEPGNVDYFTKNGSVLSNQSVRNFLIARMDSVQQYKIDITSKIYPTLQANAWMQNELRSPSGYNYQFENSITGNKNRAFRNTEIGVGIRFTRGENFIRVGRVKMRNKPPTTQLLAQLSKGLNNVMGGELDYTKAAVQFNHILNSKRLGQTTIQLEAGKVWGNVPYAYLFNAKSSLNGRIISIYVPNTFQTAGLYEFAASEMACIFIQHNFGSLLFKPKSLSFRPEFLLVQNIGFGNLQNPASHKLLVYNTPEKGLYETGLLIRNIYRKNYRLFFLGFGVGAFYRYGHYRLPDNIDNWAFKFGINFSF